MPDRRPFQLELGSGRLLHGFVDSADKPGARPTVVVCHGFKGFMEWGFFPHLADLLAARGFTAVRFNFSGAGMLPGDDRVSDLEAFAHATADDDVTEIGEVLEALRGGALAAGRVDPDRLALFGHSRGGGAAILAAAARQDLSALVTWSAVATFDRLSEEEKAAWRRTGRVTILNARTGQQLYLDRSVLEEYDSHPARYDVEAAAAAVSAPWLIVHGEEDETVPAAEARRLADAAGEGSRLELVAEGSHTFGAVHPFGGPTPALIQALNLTQSWLRAHLA